MSNSSLRLPAPAGPPALTVLIMVAEERRGELNEFLARIGGQIIILNSDGQALETTLHGHGSPSNPLLRAADSYPGSAAGPGATDACKSAAAVPHSIVQAWYFLQNRRDLRRPDGRLCGLTTAEYEALSLLHAVTPVEMSRAELAQRVFGRAYRVGDRAIDTLIHKLREKIGADAIVTLRGRGYAFAEFPES